MKRWHAALLATVAVALTAAWWRLPPRPGREVSCVAAPPRVFPELDGVTLPPNIAPPGLRLDEPGTAWCAVLRGSHGTAVAVASRRPGIAFPPRPWHRLLAANTGGSLSLTLTVRNAAGRWTQFAPVQMAVAREAIDRYLVHRCVTPLYNWSMDVGVYQRDLTNFDSHVVLHGRQFTSGCTNCHTFCQGSGDRFALGVRSDRWGGGTLVMADGQLARLKQNVGYGSWHPNGQTAVFSVNQVRQFFHAAGEESRDVLDLSSGLVCYDVARRSFTAVPGLTSPDYLATYPCWSPDGRWLYFSRAKKLWKDGEAFPPPQYDQVRYSLLRIAFDAASGTWGQAEMLRSGDEAGRSFVFPRLSPDGRWLLYTSCDYGCFPVHRPNSDLGLIDLQSGADVHVAINSDRADTWHSWSRNGRWIVFASKRADGLFTKLYLSYFDTDGKFHAPLLLPQRDPRFYDDLWYSYNVPELIDRPIRVSAGQLGRAVRSRHPVDAPLPPEVAPQAPAGR